MDVCASMYNFARQTSGGSSIELCSGDRIVSQSPRSFFQLAKRCDSHSGSALELQGGFWLNSRKFDETESQWEAHHGGDGGDTVRGAEGADRPGDTRRPVPPPGVGRPGRHVIKIWVCPEREGTSQSEGLSKCHRRQCR